MTFDASTVTLRKKAEKFKKSRRNHRIYRLFNLDEKKVEACKVDS